MKILVGNIKHGDRGHYIGRPSALGNPFSLEKEDEREQVIEQYREWFYKNIDNKEIQEELQVIKDMLKDKGEVTLLCWCSPFRCHGHVIREYLENENNC